MRIKIEWSEEEKEDEAAAAEEEGEKSTRKMFVERNRTNSNTGSSL